MGDLPLHPIVVHLPLALAVLMPVLAAAALLAWWRGWLPGRRIWAAVVALQALLLLGGVAALRTGEAEEERVEAFVGEPALEEHEEAAELFVTVAGIVLLLAVGGLAPRERIARGLAIAAVAAMAVVSALAVRVGAAGGELVYRQGAADAYVRPVEPPSLDARAAAKHGEAEHPD